MTLAMLVFLFQSNKWLFLMLVISLGLAFWGLNILIKKLLEHDAGT